MSTFSDSNQSLKILCIFFALACFMLNSRSLAARVYAQSEKGDEEFSELINNLNKGDINSQAAVIDYLGYLGNAQAVPALLESLNDSRLVIRWKVYVALSRIGQPEAVEKVAEAIKKEDEAFWTALTEGMSLGGQNVLEDIVAIGLPLVERLKGLGAHQNFQVRNMAKTALEEIEKKQK